ncbi:MAG: SPFH domain-containing protein [Patescibacteria group bacterium]|nr:SPFH domain-containing protein [Patescibacteria group bacterium]
MPKSLVVLIVVLAVTVIGFIATVCWRRVVAARRMRQMVAGSEETVRQRQIRDLIESHRVARRKRKAIKMPGDGWKKSGTGLWQTILRVERSASKHKIWIVVVWAVLGIVGIALSLAHTSVISKNVRMLFGATGTLLVIGLALHLVAKSKVHQRFSHWLDRWIYTLDDQTLKIWYFLIFIATSCVVFLLCALIPDRLVGLVIFIAWLITTIYVVDGLAKRELCFAYIREAAAMIFVRKGMFLRVGWTFRNRRMITTQAALRLNCLYFLICSRKAQVKDVLDALRAALGDAEPFRGITSEASNIQSDLELARQIVAFNESEAQRILDAISHIPAYEERFWKYDIMTHQELVDEIPGLPPDMLDWCIADCRNVQSPRHGILGGLRVIGAPWDTVMEHTVQIETWTDKVDDKGVKVRIPGSETLQFKEIGLGRIQLRVHVVKAETADGPAVEFFMTLYVNVRNVYKAYFEIDNWRKVVITNASDVTRDLSRALPFFAVFDARGPLAEFIIEGVKGNKRVVCVTPMPQDKETGKPRYRIEVLDTKDTAQQTVGADGQLIVYSRKADILRMALQQCGVVITALAIEEVNPVDQEGKDLLSMQIVAERKAVARETEGRGEAAFIRQRVQAYADKGPELGRDLARLDTVAAAKGGAIVQIGESSTSEALLATLLKKAGRAAPEDTREVDTESGKGKKP